VVSAGNFHDDACKHSPAGVPGTIVVAASTPNDRAWSDGGSYGSGYGRCVDLYAPGQKVTAALAGGGTTTENEGATSWAAPHATGVIALYLSAHPHATANQVHVWLDHTATPGVLRGVPSDTPNRLLNTGGLWPAPVARSPMSRRLLPSHWRLYCWEPDQFIPHPDLKGSPAV
jgi:subtilisin family serine protease